MMAGVSRHEDRKKTLADLKNDSASLQWFLATASKQLGDFRRVTLNISVNGSLANQFQTCWDKLSPQSLDEEDPKFALRVVQARMFDVYEAEVQATRLQRDLEDCQCRCQNNCSNSTAVNASGNTSGNGSTSGSAG